MKMKEKSVFKLVLWILFFPFTLTYYGWKKKNNNKLGALICTILSVALLIGCGTESGVDDSDVANVDGTPTIQVTTIASAEVELITTTKATPATETIKVNKAAAGSVVANSSNNTLSKQAAFKGYKIIEVDGGDISGYREPNVAIEIGFGDREYWAFTNAYGQLVKVTAKEIILQDDNKEPVNSEGRYYEDEAKVPGVENSDLDEGHVIADSLGGVSNAYNITPQDSTLNRHGDQAYMESVIRDADGCTDFEAIITYPDTKTQIPSKYSFTYTLMGNVIHDEFANGNPDVANAKLNTTVAKPVATTTKAMVVDPVPSGNTNDISKIDTNGNGTVTIAEAKAAGFKMPIKRGHWLYEYMIDKDGDGQVGE